MEFIFIVYFLPYTDEGITKLKAFKDEGAATEYALKIGEEAVNKKFSSIIEMELWYNDTLREMDIPGRVILEQTELK